MDTAQVTVQTAAAAAAWDWMTSAAKQTLPETGTSFQTLLQQRANTGKNTESDSAAPETPEDGAPLQETKPQANRGVISMDLAALGAAWLAGGMNWSVPAAPAAVEPQETAVAVVADASQTTAPAAQEASFAEAGTVGNALPEQTAEKAPAQAPAVQTDAAAAVPVTRTQDGGQMPAVQGAQEETAPAFQEQPQGQQKTEWDDTVQVTDYAAGQEAPVFSQTEHMPVKVGEATVDTTVPAPQLEKTLEKTLTQGLDDGAQRLEIRLTPEHLGTVQVEFTRTAEGALHVVLRAENPEAAKLLGDHAGALGMLLQENTHAPVRVEVPQQEASRFQQGDPQGGQQQQQQQQQHRAPRQEAESFLHQLRLGLVDAEPEEIR